MGVPTANNTQVSPVDRLCLLPPTFFSLPFPYLSGSLVHPELLQRSCHLFGLLPSATSITVPLVQSERLRTEPLSNRSSHFESKADVASQHLKQYTANRPSHPCFKTVVGNHVALCALWSRDCFDSNSSVIDLRETLNKFSQYILHVQSEYYLASDTTATASYRSAISRFVRPDHNLHPIPSNDVAPNIQDCI